MKVLVGCASKYGSTAEIAGRIADRLTAAGHETEARSVRAVGQIRDYEAFVIGSAMYMGHWQTDALEFVRRHRAVLVGRPTWLFSSGPLGTETTDAEVDEVREAAGPEELDELREAVRPRDHRVFFGALDANRLGLPHRLVRALPAGRALMPAGDFRDWSEIEAWADGIAGDLLPVETPASVSA